jgi:hypothetical protein
MRRAVSKLSNVASQVMIAVVATGLASTLFGTQNQAAVDPTATGKITTRIENAFAPATILALSPQDAMALSSIQRFRPMAFEPTVAAAPEAPAPKPVAAAPSKPRSHDVARVLPPARPPQAVLVAAAPVAPQAPAAVAPETKPHGVTIAGVAVPLPDVDFKRYIPSGDDMLGTFSRAKSVVERLAHVSSR